MSRANLAPFIAAALLAGCNAILGIGDDYRLASSGGAGGSGVMTNAGTVGTAAHGGKAAGGAGRSAAGEDSGGDDGGGSGGSFGVNGGNGGSESRGGTSTAASGQGGEAGADGSGATGGLIGGNGGKAGEGGNVTAMGGANSAGASSGGGGAAGGGAGGAADGGGAGAAAGTGGTGGGVATASGCARLTVPLDAMGDKAHFVETVSPVDLSAPGQTIVMRIYIAAGAGGNLYLYVSDTQASPGFLRGSTLPVPLSGTGTWQTIIWDVGNFAVGSSTIQKNAIKRVGIEIIADQSSGWADATVFVDSITINAATPITLTFATTGTVNPSTSLTDNATTQVLWLNTYTGDTSATGSALTWVATCP